MKRSILISLLLVGAVVAVIAGATTAYFSDPEKATGTFSAGVIDISVDGENPWEGSFDLADLKPSETGLIEFTIHNDGDNPVVVWKHIGNVVTEGGVTTEPELDDDPSDTTHDIDTVTNYDLSVDSTVIFADEDNLSVDDIQSMWMPVGTIPGDGDLDVTQSYHMRGDTGNWAQGDVMTFDIDLYAEQRLGSGPDQLSSKLFLDNKTGEPDWYFVADDTWGILTWGSAASLHAQGLQASTAYSLITYAEPWPGTVSVLANGPSNASGNLDLAPTMPATYTGKIWLVLSADTDGTKMTGWNPTAYLFESNLVSIP